MFSVGKRLVCVLLVIMTVHGLSAQSFCLKSRQGVDVCLPPKVEPVVESAFRMLTDDVHAVLGSVVSVSSSEKKADIVCRIDKTLSREGFRLEVCKGRLHVTGADGHGLAYGLLEVSRLMGVSPWVWWADCTPPKLDTFTLPESFSTNQSPAVKFRGIFINDEDWGMLPWATHQEQLLTDADAPVPVVNRGRRGVVGPVANERIFQLLLRLRGNYFWPAMHECTEPFFTVPGNREMAARYGIYIGGSHCEPMACSPATEWAMRGQGDYNYVSNGDAVRSFWQHRIDEVKGQEIVYTIGMRGVHDGSMQGVKTREEKLHWLQQVIDDQRAMLSSALNRPASQIPQVFVPYKEVLQIYEDGLRVPDDVTLMWTDDNYGYIRHFPDSIEATRRGGNGIYYHVSYWGRPHDYLWLGTSSPYLMRQQMTEAYRHGVRDVWVLNVGDLKPAEYQTELWMDMAWHGVANYAVVGEDSTAGDGHLRMYLSREFGESMADELLPLMQEHYRLAFQRKPEMMAGTRTEEADRRYWSTPHPIDGWTREDVSRRVASYQQLSDKVEQLWERVPANQRDAFFQLIKYPVQGAAQMNFKFLCPGRSAEAYDSIAVLTQRYNDGFDNGGKWRCIMNSAPRGLPVFGRVDTTFAYPSADPHRMPVSLRAACAATQGVTPINGLGYDGTSWALSKGASISVPVTLPSASDSVTVELHLLPSLPVEGRDIAVEVSVDGHAQQPVAYQTYDRSEEWKQNVLRNQAIRRVRLPLSSADAHQPHSCTVTIRAITEGVVLDQVFLCP